MLSGKKNEIPSWCLGLFVALDYELFLDSKFKKVLFLVPASMKSSIRLNNDEVRKRDTNFLSIQHCLIVSQKAPAKNSRNENIVKIGLAPIAVSLREEKNEVYSLPDEDAQVVYDQINVLMDSDKCSGFNELVRNIYDYFIKTKEQLKLTVSNLDSMLPVFDRMANEMIEKMLENNGKHEKDSTIDLSYVQSLKEIMKEEMNGYLKLMIVMRSWTISLVHADEHVSNVIHDVMLLVKFQFDHECFPNMVYKGGNCPDEYADLPVSTLYKCVLDVKNPVNLNLDLEQASQSTNMGFIRVSILEGLQK